jgi:murein L,D-transpeptidase YcbB/YkuD
MISILHKKAVQRAGRPVRPARLVLSSIVICALTSGALPATAALAAAVLQSDRVIGGQAIADFYAGRADKPLFLAPGNEQAVQDLLRLLNTAKVDGLDPNSYRLKDLRRAVRIARNGKSQALRRAEFMLAQAYVGYVRDLRGRAPDLGMIYVDARLRPSLPEPRLLLDEAAAAPSLVQHMGSMAWMHSYYAPLRQAALQTRDPARRALVAVNLERIRLLPAANAGRYVLVNAAEQRLYMMGGATPVDSMRVVVGKPVHATPMMAALIRFTSLNPYWNVPADLAAERVAPFVLKGGNDYLREQGYQLLSDWTDKAKVISPSTVDWRAVAEGRQQVRLRQLPGPANSMGDMKFMFPNVQGVYLHDTPSTELFAQASRFVSGGCVRLEAAPRLARWLHGKPIKAKGARPEQRVDLPQPVPVYLTYLTMVPSESGELATYDDIYGRDARRLAQLGNSNRGGPIAGR